jgi:hypothetical protein
MYLPSSRIRRSTSAALAVLHLFPRHLGPSRIHHPSAPHSVLPGLRPGYRLPRSDLFLFHIANPIRRARERAPDVGIPQQDHMGV